MTISKNLEAVESTLCQAINTVGRKRSDVTLIAVTKAVSNEATKEIYDLGIRHLAENRPEGLQAKKLIYQIMTSNGIILVIYKREK